MFIFALKLNNTNVFKDGPHSDQYDTYSLVINIPLPENNIKRRRPVERNNTKFDEHEVPKK